MTHDTEVHRATTKLIEASNDLLNTFDHPDSAPQAADVLYAIEVVLGDFEGIVGTMARDDRLWAAFGSGAAASRLAALNSALLTAAATADRLAHRRKYE